MFFAVSSAVRIVVESGRRAFPNGEMATQTVWTRKANRLKVGIARGKLPFRSGIWKRTCYNLVPAIGEINGLRSNCSYAMIPGEKRDFGKCDMEIYDRKAEPAPEKREDIARTYFYMAISYPGRGVISEKNRKLFQAWDKEDPVDEWDCERCKRIGGTQGNENSFLKKPCIEKGMW